MLLRVNLDGTCIEAVPGSDERRAMCTAPATCILGICASDVATSLEPYAPNWPTNVPDVYKPANAGPAVVQVGAGADGLPAADRRPDRAIWSSARKGHHIWIATRMENLRQSGSTTTISSAWRAGPSCLDDGVRLQLRPGRRGFCQLYGLRWLDATGEDHQFLGKPLDVTVTIQFDGRDAETGPASIVIGLDAHLADGTSDCNN